MRKRLYLLAGTLAILLAASRLPAQQVTAALTGTVTDSSGGVVPEAKITLHDDAKGIDVRTATADSTGVYTVPQIPYGTYTVTIEAKGFQKYVANDVILHVGDRRTLDVVLQVGQVSQEVTVTATATPLETSTSSQEGTVTSTQVRELQLNNRNFEQLLTLQPGVSSLLPDQVGFGLSNTSSVSVNGARTGANNWTVDGADVNDSGSNLTLLNVPSVDALTEFKLARSTYDAQYGRSGGGQVNVVTKSGTSDFHGDAYEFFRNDVLNASPYLTNASKGKKPSFRYNNFGFTIGGPVYIPGHYNTNKSKTFFFYSEEWRRTRVPSTGTGTLPSAAQLGGTFTGTQLNLASAPAGCITNDPVANSAQIDPTCFSANAKVYIANVYGKLTPNAPNNRIITSLEGLNNYRQDLIRLDQRISERVQVFARYINDQVPTTEPGGLFASSPLPGISSTATNAPGRNVVAHLTLQLTPSIINEVAFNYSWGAINSNPTGLFTSPAFLGALTTANFPFSDPYGRIPGVSITGFSGVAIPSAPYHERNVDKNFYDYVTWIHGNHSIRTGVSNQWMRKSENGPTATNGSFSFLKEFGNPAFANFLLGDADSFTQANHDVIPDIHFINLGVFAQDDWRVRSNLTLNLGLRYDYLATPHDINGILTNFDPRLFDASAAPLMDPSTGRFVAGQTVTPANYLNGIIVGGKNSPFGNQVNPNYDTNFSPRFGFSWDPFKSGITAVRGGYGIYYDRTLNGIWEQNQFTNPPVVATLSLTNTSTPTNLFDNPSGGTAPASVLNPRNLIITGSPDFKVPNYQGWNLSVQRQVMKNTVVEVAYVGGKGTHLLGVDDFNQVPVSARLANPTVNREALRPYRGWRVITQRTTEFNSNYHSLQISANRRVAEGLTFGMAYTWSKTMTDSSSDRNAGDASYNTYNRSLDRAPALFSRPQILVINYVYALPFYRNQQGLTGRALGGWQISGISTFQDGTPMLIRQSNDPFDNINGSGIGIDPSTVQPRSDLVGNPHGAKTAQQWFNTAAFKDAVGHFGNAGRGLVLGPGRNNWDFSLFKNTRINERFTTQFRAEFFNTFNHTQFSGVGNNIDVKSTAGVVTATHDPRIIQLGLKLYF